MNAKEIRQAVERYLTSGRTSVGIEFHIKRQPLGVQQKFWNLVERKAN